MHRRARATTIAAEVRLRIEARPEALGLALPAPLVLPPGVSLPVPWVRVRGSRAFLSGHNPLESDGTLGKIRGQVGVGAHARTAVGVSTLPQNLPVIVSGEVEIAPA